MTTRDEMIKHLKNRLRTKHLLTVVGTGVSAAATLNQQIDGHKVTSWPGLIAHGIEYGKRERVFERQPEIIELVQDLIRNGTKFSHRTGDLVDAATELVDAFERHRPGLIATWLTSVCSQLELKDREVIDAVAGLSGVLATLNYDHLLEQATGRETLSWHDKPGVNLLMNGTSEPARFVLHLHGSYQHWASVVFDRQSYRRVNEDFNAFATRNSLAATRTLLFVGCGQTLEDLTFRNLIAWCDQFFKDIDALNFILCLEDDEPKLQKALEPLHWLKPLSYGTAYNHLPAFLRRLHPDPVDSIPEVGRGNTLDATAAPPPTAKPTPAIRLYLTKLAENHKFLAMRGMNTDFGVELPIDKVYVPLTTTPGRMDERLESDRSRGMKGRDDNFRRIDRDIELNDVFRESESQHYRGIILLGEPGAGKTTGARQLAWRLASGHSLPEDLGLPAGIRPVFLRLRNLDPATIDTQGSDSDPQFAILSLRRFLDQETHCPGGSSEEQNPGPDLWDASLHGHGLLWILDGLDEVVDPQLRAIVAGWIRDILPERPADRFFVTSRFQGYQNRDVALGERFLEMHVKPLSKDQITQFVTQWFQAAHRRIDGNTAQAEENAASDRVQLLDVLKTSPYQSPSMLAMVANPMLLTIVCIVFKRDHNLPTARAELYKQCVVVLLESWRAEKFKKTRQRIDKPFEVHAARSVLAKLAWWMHQAKDRSEVPIAELSQEATTALQRVSPEANLGIDGREFIERMRQESGILAMSGEGKGKIGFLHLSFQEYLTAEYAARQGLAGELARQVSDSWWREAALLSLRCDASEEYVKTFFTRIVSDGLLESNPDLSERCIRETILFPPEPFLEVLERPTASPSQTASVLRVLRSRQKQVPQLADLCRKFMGSPHEEVNGLAREILVGLGVDVPRSPAATPSPATPVRPAASPQVVASPTSVEPAALRVDDRTGQTLLWIPADGFRMGSKKGDADEKPVRDVRFTHGFYLGKYPVTNEQYGRFLSEQTGQVRVPEYWDNRRFNQPEQPVVGVSWDEAVAYCQWAGGRLPTEAEWEYACRAGSPAEYCFGDDAAQLGDYAWFRDNSGGQTQPVGRKKANAWGFHDMHGNVWEWCQDWFGDYDARDVVDPAGRSRGSDRVLRGGSWNLDAADCRAAYRLGVGPSYRGYYCGFRLALSFVGVPGESGQDKNK